jgi:hypothetical protein
MEVISMMDMLLFFAIALGALFIIVSVLQVSIEIRKTRLLLQEYFRLEPFKLESTGETVFRNKEDNVGNE